MTEARRATIDAEQLLNEFCGCNDRLIRLHVAENILLSEELRASFCGPYDLGTDDFKYQSSHGREDLRSAVASFLSRSFRLDPALSEKHISFFSGTRCAVEMATRGQPSKFPPSGRQVLLPTPCWQGFRWIYRDRLGARIEPVPVPVDDWALTLEAIQRAYRGGGSRAQILALTNPQNPLSVNYAPELLEEIYAWVLRETTMDVVSDEIYAHCQTKPIHQSTFHSALRSPWALEFPDRFHVAWGFAKDFGVSGFRVGVLASRHEAIHQEVQAAALAGFSPMTSSNNWFLRKLFEPAGGKTVADGLMETLASRLKQRFEVVRGALTDARIPFYEASDAAQFVWLDLRRWLGTTCPEEPDEGSLVLDRVEMLDFLGIDEEEKQLLACLAATAGVQLLPGLTLGAPEPGFFRLCLTAVDEERVLAAIGCIARVLHP